MERISPPLTTKIAAEIGSGYDGVIEPVGVGVAGGEVVAVGGVDQMIAVVAPVAPERRGGPGCRR